VRRVCFRRLLLSKSEKSASQGLVAIAVEKIARESLHMQLPASARVEIVESADAAGHKDDDR
jgi:cell division protein FtsL